MLPEHQGGERPAGLLLDQGKQALWKIKTCGSEAAYEVIQDSVVSR